MSSQRSRSAPGARRTEGHGGHVRVNAVYADPSPGSPRVKVKPRTVPCPSCSAEVGDPCVNPAGAPLQAFHLPRRRMATRLRNELIAVGEETVKQQPKPKTLEFETTVVEAGACPVCSSTVPLRNALYSDRERGVRVKDRVLARHTQDGGRVRGTNPACPGSEGLPT